MSFRSLKKEIPVDKEVEFKGEKFKVKQYLTYAEKKLMINNIIQDSFVLNSNGIEYCDELKFDVFKVFNILKYCTDINLPTYTENEEKMYDIVTTYDYARGSGLWDFVIECIPKEEYEFVCDKLQEARWVKEEEIETNKHMVLKNSINELVMNANSFVDGLCNINNKIINFIDNAENKFEKGDIKKAVGKLINEAKKILIDPKTKDVVDKVTNIIDFNNGINKGDNNE